MQKLYGREQGFFSRESFGGHIFCTIIERTFVIERQLSLLFIAIKRVFIE
jgi:hypothetical protein